MIRFIIILMTMSMAQDVSAFSFDNDSNTSIAQLDTATCAGICIGFPHPTLDGIVFYLNGLGGGLIVNEKDLLNDEFDSLSMFPWSTRDHLRTRTEAEFINFSNWEATAARSDQFIIDAYGANGNYAALAIREQLGAAWRLPTATEAYYIDLNLNKAGLGNFTKGHYWTSSEVNYVGADIAPTNVVAIDMANGTLTTDLAKVQALKVRAVRAF